MSRLIRPILRRVNCWRAKPPRVSWPCWRGLPPPSRQMRARCGALWCCPARRVHLTLRNPLPCPPLRRAWRLSRRMCRIVWRASRKPRVIVRRGARRVRRQTCKPSARRLRFPRLKPRLFGQSLARRGAGQFGPHGSVRTHKMRHASMTIARPRAYWPIMTRKNAPDCALGLKPARRSTAPARRVRGAASRPRERPLGFLQGL